MAQQNSPERWLSVVGYEGLYEVSDRGQVRSLPRPTHNGIGRPIVGGILKPSRLGGRYPAVSLYKDGKQRVRTIHRLVLESFVGPCTPGQQALHANDVNTDNRLENLSWGTSKKNAADRFRNGRTFNAVKNRCKHGHVFDSENTAWTKAGKRRCLKCERRRAAADRERVNHDLTRLEAKRKYAREWVRAKRANTA